MTEKSQGPLGVATQRGFLVCGYVARSQAKKPLNYGDSLENRMAGELSLRPAFRARPACVSLMPGSWVALAKPLALSRT